MRQPKSSETYVCKVYTLKNNQLGSVMIEAKTCLSKHISGRRSLRRSNAKTLLENACQIRETTKYRAVEMLPTCKIGRTGSMPKQQSLAISKLVMPSLGPAFLLVVPLNSESLQYFPLIASMCVPVSTSDVILQLCELL